VDRLQALVHTHGTRLVRLAYLLGVDEPEGATADALARTMLTRRHGDAHEELLAVALEVGARAEPPIHDNTRLQGWLDRAEVDTRDVDLLALQAEAVRRLAVQRDRRATYRRRTVAAATVAVAVVAGASLIDGRERPAPRPPPPLATDRIEGYPPDPASGPPVVRASPVNLSGSLPAAPADLPVGQESAAGVVVADLVLAGPTTPIATVHIEGAPATVLAVSCAPRGEPASVCVLVLMRDQPLRSAEGSSLLAVLPIPPGDSLVSRGLPSLGRISFVDEFHHKTMLMEVTSADVDAVRVDFPNGQYAYARRLSAPGADAALFVAVTVDATPATVTYMSDGTVLHRRSLYSATP